MSKHLWRFAGGIVVFMTFYLPYRFGKYIVVSADEFWNKSILEKILGRELPFLGFFISIALFYFIGAANETRIALWLREKLLNKIPILNKFISSLSAQSKNVIQGSKGFFLAPFWDGYRPAKLTAVLKKKSGNFGVFCYMTIPPTVQVLPDSVIIYVLEKIKADEREIYLIPSDTAIRIEFSAGTTIPENALKDAIPITLADFLRSRKLIKEE
ncbi:MAG TPA: hypothetical protein VJC01_02375 [Candidatus Paceibacterota bacterium]